jgi:cytochrome c oxidase assembly protein subunit 11
MTTEALHLDQKNRRVGLIALAVVAAMVGLAYASVPLYQLFCRVTGFGGTTQVSVSAPGAAAGAIMRQVAFNSHVSPELKWHVAPPKKASDVLPGDEITINYVATNISDQPITGTSSYNVTPNKIGPYFMKIECFCFTEQTLQPGESVEMPVIFYLDPEIDQDINTKATPEITLSYTFFAVNKDGG